MPCTILGRKTAGAAARNSAGARGLLVFSFLAALFGGFFGALACAFRSPDVIGVLIWFLHRELENKTCRLASQEFLEKFTYTKVTSGGAPSAAWSQARTAMWSPDGRGTNAQ
ncbi:MAG TPA: hypothetical protein VJT08_06590 [Terriglobales bacterium]|nr:hypothetical protein [Terriglobales bacterium]